MRGDAAVRNGGATGRYGAVDCVLSVEEGAVELVC